MIDESAFTELENTIKTFREHHNIGKEHYEPFFYQLKNNFKSNQLTKITFNDDCKIPKFL